MTTLRISLVAWMLLTGITKTQGQLFQIPSIADGFDNNLIPEWLPQCFSGVDTFDPVAVVDCVQDQVLPSCLEGPAAIAETFEGVAKCITGSVGEDVMQFFQGFTGDDGDITNQLTEVLSSRKGGDNENDNELSDLVDGFLSGIGEEAEGLFDTAGLFVNSTRACLDPLTDCVQETIQQAVDNLDPCLNASLTELVECGQQNGEACSESCNATQIQSQFQSNPFEVALSQVGTCPLIQGNIVDPFCTLVGCCEPCVPKAEALLNCVVNRQLDQVPILAGDCALTCPATAGRRLGTRQSTSRKNRRRTQAQDGFDNHSPDECLQFAPGLTGDDGKELSARSSIFLPCAYNSFAKAIQEGPVVVSTATEGESDGTSSEAAETEPESSAAARFQWAGAAAVLVFAFAN